MKRVIMLIVFLMAMITCSLAEELLAVEAPETVTGYAENPVTVRCGAEGLLTLEVWDESGAVYRLADRQTVPAGETTLAWDGLGAWDMPLEKGKYTLCARLEHAGGYAEAFDEVTLKRNEQALVFALASAETIYQKAKTPLEIEYRLVRAGRVVIEICAADAPEEPLIVRRRTVENSKPTIYSWDGKIRSEFVPEGSYIIRMYAEENPERVIEIPVRMAAERESAPLLTGPIMPESAEAIWDAVCAPAVVAAVGEEQFLRVWRGPDKTTELLGTIGGQTQCVEVVEAGDEWTKISCWRQEDGAPIIGYVQTARLKVVDVHTEYGLVVDKAAQTLTVYRRGEKLGSMPISTGSAAYRKLDRETPAGSYLTGEHFNTLTVDGEKCRYAIRFGGNRALYLAQGIVGEKTTSGGVAVGGSAVDETQLDAYWLWSHIPRNTRLIILDDPAQRTLENACAQAQVDMSADTWRLTAQADMLSEGETEVVLTLGGDAVIGTREAWMSWAEAFPAYLKREGMAYPFSGLQAYFTSDDMTFVNLEGVLKENARGEDKERPCRFRGLPEWTAVLTEGSIEKVNIANNHHVDYGGAGKASTIEALDAAGIPYSGYGATYIWEIEGHKIGFGGCRETTWLQGKQDIAAEIASLRAAGCEVVLYSCHWGEEYNPRHNETQLAMMQAIVAAGADVIIGHHPHVVQGVDEIDGTLVLYSLGNLMFGGTHDMKTFDGALARLSLRFDEDGYRGAALTMIPILTSSTPGLNDFRPMPAEGEDALRILSKIQADSGVIIRENMFFPSR